MTQLYSDKNVNLLFASPRDGAYIIVDTGGDTVYIPRISAEAIANRILAHIRSIELTRIRADGAIERVDATGHTMTATENVDGLSRDALRILLESSGTDVELRDHAKRINARRASVGLPPLEYNRLTGTLLPLNPKFPDDRTR